LIEVNMAAPESTAKGDGEDTEKNPAGTRTGAEEFAGQ
jgi:hypothetical protein